MRDRQASEGGESGRGDHVDVRPVCEVAAEAVRAAVVTRRAHYLSVVRRHAGQLVDAEEILQAAFARALARCEQLRDPTRAQAWVEQVVRHTLADELRRPRRGHSLDDGPELAAHGVEVAATRCGCVLAQAERLKPEYAAVLRRVILHGSSVTELAAELGMTANSATVRLHRARRALRARLAAHCGTTSAAECEDCGCSERGCCGPPGDHAAPGADDARPK